jgi:RimJ/RimL family protein N-acetyltransferase
VEIDAGPVFLRPIAAEVARALLDGREPAGIVFAEGYPSRFSLEVMDILAGPRSETRDHAFSPCFVVRRCDGAVVGEIGHNLDAETGTAQVGYSIVQPAWGRGFATAALRGLIEHLGSDPEVRRVVAETLVEHRASRRVMEKAGMRACDERVGEEDGNLVTLVVYEWTKPGRSSQATGPR